MNVISLLFVIALSIGSLSPWLQSGNNVATEQGVADKTQRYNGDWWLAADAEERSGFLEGAADCLTWTAHEKGFSATSSQLSAKITNFYETHSSERPLLVTDVWRKIEPEAGPPKPTSRGESWKNAHWYLNGLWWRQSSEAEQSGFLEGYLWCVRTYAKSPSPTYSRSADHYAGKINAYLKAHPKGDDESIASILLRYRDKQTNEQKADHQGK